MSAEHLLNSDCPDDSRPPMSADQMKQLTGQISVLLGQQNGPSYFDLVSMRIEAASRLSRALFTLNSANVIDWKGKQADALELALKVAENHWANICNGFVPVVNEDSTTTLRPDLPACVEAFRIVVMENAQREALEIACHQHPDHLKGFRGLLSINSNASLQLGHKHTCDGNCDHD